MNKIIFKLTVLFALPLFAAPLFAQKAQPPAIDNPAEKIAEAAPEKAGWTVMIFSSSNNDLSQDLYTNLIQMQNAGVKNGVNVLVQIGTVDKTCTSKDIHALRYKLNNKELVTHCGPLTAEETAKNLPEQVRRADMGSKQTLLNFVNKAVKDFPASQYALIISNHGYGAKDFLGADRSGLEMAIAYDSTTGNMIRTKQIGEIVNAISTQMLGGKKLDLLAFDACAMQSMEVLSYVKDYAKIIIGSQTPVGTCGFKYDEFLTNLTPVTPSEELADSIFTTFANSKCVHDADKASSTLSVIPLHKFNYAGNLLDEWVRVVTLPATLQTAVANYKKDPMLADRTSEELIDIYKFELHKGSSGLRAKPTSVRDSGFTKEQESIDIANYLDTLAQSDIFAFSKQLQKITEQTRDYFKNRFVLKNFGNKSYSRGSETIYNGISVYMMHNSYDEGYGNELFAKNSCWNSYLQWLLSKDAGYRLQCPKFQEK